MPPIWHFKNGCVLNFGVPRRGQALAMAGWSLPICYTTGWAERNGRRLATVCLSAPDITRYVAIVSILPAVGRSNQSME